MGVWGMLRKILKNKPSESEFKGISSLVPRSLYSILFVVAKLGDDEKGSGGSLQQTRRFWESLISVDNYKGFSDEVSITIVSCSYVIK